MKKLAIALVITFPLFTIGSPAQAKPCSKIGSMSGTQAKPLVCTKVGGKFVWRVKLNSGKGGESTTTNTTVVKSQTFFTPSIASDGLGVCEIQDRSLHRVKYPKGPYVGFPRRPINSFRSSGVLNYAMIPVDWADLPGNENQLQESVKQANLYKSFMEMASQGRVKINWKIHPSWVRMSGVSTSWYTPNPWPANVAFGEAAIAVADREFDFSNIDAVIFFLPESQGVFLEGTQGTVDSGLDRPFRTAEGNVPSFIVMGKYFERYQKNHWSAWVHYSLIWMGLPQLVDVKYNGPGAPERAIPIGNMNVYDIMSTQDGPSRQLSGWLRFLLDWLGPDQIYCKNLENISTIRLSLMPVGQDSAGLKLALVRISDTKIVAIESRRLDKRFDCDQPINTLVNGPIVYIVDSTQGHVTGETMSVVTPSNRVLTRSNCNVPLQLNPVMNMGDYVDVLGLRIKVLESDTFDTIEITRP